MKNNVFSVFDEKGREFGRPFNDVNVATAIRGFGQVIAQGGENNMYANYPEDYKLYHLGTFETETGKFENFEIPRLVSSAVDFKQKKGVNDNVEC